MTSEMYSLRKTSDSKQYVGPLCSSNTALSCKVHDIMTAIATTIITPFNPFETSTNCLCRTKTKRNHFGNPSSYRNYYRTM